MILESAARGDAPNLLREIRARSLYSSYYFVKVVLGYSELVDHFHQKEMDRFIDEWSRGRRKQAIEWPRGFFKTTCFTIGTGIWVVLPVSDADTDFAIGVLGIPEEDWIRRTNLHDQDATQLLAFETEQNACKKIVSIKHHFEENQLFRALFPEIAYDGSQQPWNQKELRINRVGARRRDPEGTFEAIGVGGALQSRHYKIVWEDDPVGEKARKSTVVMEDTIGWHNRLNGAYENASEQIRFLVSNRWGYADLNSWVRVNEPDVSFHTRSSKEIDSDGQCEASFPERYSLEKLDEISKTMSKYDYSCQYMNVPTAPGESEVNGSMIHQYTVESNGQMICSCGYKCFPSQLNRYLHYDPYNAKAAGSTSCPALAVVGCSMDKHVFLLDFFVGKEGYSRVYDRMFHFNNVWRPMLFTYEDVGHQNLTEYTIRSLEKTKEFQDKKHRRFPTIVGCPTGNRSKETRIREGLFPHIEKGKFSIRKLKAQLLLDMLETFPFKRLDHDYDLLDSLAQGAEKWRFPLSQDDVEKDKREEADYLRKFNEPYAVRTHYVA